MFTTPGWTHAEELSLLVGELHHFPRSVCESLVHVVVLVERAFDESRVSISLVVEVHQVVAEIPVELVVILLEVFHLRRLVPRRDCDPVPNGVIKKSSRASHSRNTIRSDN